MQRMDAPKNDRPNHLVPKTKPEADIKSWQRWVANALSYLFHPVFIPTYLTLLLLWSPIPEMEAIDPATKQKWLGIAAYLSIFFPLITLLLLKALKFVKDFHLPTQRDRIGPLMATMIFYFWVYQVFSKQFESPLPLSVLYLGAFWGIVVLFLANIFYKVSMHLAGLGGALTLLFILMLQYGGPLGFTFLLALIAATLTAWARYRLKAHTWLELVLGLLLGIIAQTAAYLFLI